MNLEVIISSEVFIKEPLKEHQNYMIENVMVINTMITVS